MIEVYTVPGDLDGERIEERLRELVAEFRVVRVSRSEGTGLLGADVSLPAIRDDQRVIHGADQIARFLEDTEAAVERWRRFQSDACYLDDEGESC